MPDVQVPQRWQAELDGLLEFLKQPTPSEWFTEAPRQLGVLLNDHANCEKKAAGAALSVLFRYVDKPVLCQRLSRLAREELRHFEQVQQLIRTLGLPLMPVSASRYAAGLRSVARTHEPGRLIDVLLMGAIVEARSCERFIGLLSVLPPAVCELYERLVESESRHFTVYLDLARDAAGAHDEHIEMQLARLLDLENMLISTRDEVFRFHSGPVCNEN